MPSTFGQKRNSSTDVYAVQDMLGEVHIAQQMKNREHFKKFSKAKP